MIAVFAKFGHVTSTPLQKRKTVNAEWYINIWKTVNAEWYVNICVPKVFEACTAHRPNNGTRGLLLHHENAHTAAATLHYLEANHPDPVFHGLSRL